MSHTRKHTPLTRTLAALLALVLLIGLLPVNVLAVDDETVPVWEQGTIASANGLFDDLLHIFEELLQNK